MKRVCASALVVLVGIVAGANPAFAQEAFSFTKGFGAASIPMNGTTSLTFNLTGFPTPLIDSFTDTLPAGLVVATPNGLSGPFGCGPGVAAATPGSSVVSMSAASFGVCTFSVNVTGTSPGLKNNSVTDALDLETATASLTVTASPSGEAGTELQNYFSNANVDMAGNALVNITAPFEGNATIATGAVRDGETCAMIYVFDTSQAMQECCGCPLTADGLLTLSITNQLVQQPVGDAVAGVNALENGSIRILSSLPFSDLSYLGDTIPPWVGCDHTTSVCCDPTGNDGGFGPGALTPANELVAWAQHIQTTTTTEDGFEVAPASASDFTDLPAACAGIASSGSGAGICICGSGG